MGDEVQFDTSDVDRWIGVPLGAQIVDVGPPRTEIFLSLPRWPNATQSPSGEKNGA